MLIGWVLSPMTFVLIRGERLRCTGSEGHVEADRGEGEVPPDPETQEPPEAGGCRKDSPLQTWEEVWPTDPLDFDLQPSQL